MIYTVVIAAYNEVENIAPLTSRLIATLDPLKGVQWKLIYVIDGTDGTSAAAQKIADTRPEIQIISNSEPSGLGNAFRRGFAAIPPETGLVITMDADLNHQPEEIPRLVECLFSRKADIVVGSRKVRGSVVDGMPRWKATISDGVNRMMRRVLGVPVADMTSGYRVYRYAALSSIPFDNAGFAFLPEILIRAHAMHLKIVEEPIRFIFRTAGESKMKIFSTAKSYLGMLGSRLKQRL